MSPERRNSSHGSTLLDCLGRVTRGCKLCALVLVALAVTSIALDPLPAHASSRDADKVARDMERQQRRAQREMERAAREAESQRRAAEREAEKQRQAAERDAERAAAAAQKAAAAAAAIAAESRSAKSDPKPENARATENTKAAESSKSRQKQDDDDNDDDKPAPTASQGKNQKQESTASRPPAKEPDPVPATVGEVLSRLGEFFSGSGADKPDRASPKPLQGAPAANPQAAPVTALTTGTLPANAAGAGGKPGTQHAPPAAKGQQTAAKGEPAKHESPKAEQAKSNPAKALPPAPPAMRVARAPWKPEEIKLDRVTGKEVLAVNLDAKGIAAAQSKGFKVGKSTNALGANVTTLVPPANMDPIAARVQLEKELPQAVFAFNSIYHGYRSAQSDGEPTTESRLGVPPTPVLPRPRPPQGQAMPGAPVCQGERCYGWTLIDWTDHGQKCATGVKVGVIDTSIDHAHPALRHVKAEVGVFLPAGATKAPVGHGTGVAALLFGDRKSATPGLIPDAQPVIAEAFYEDKDGQVTSTTLKLVEALAWLETTGVRVINMSFSGPKDELLEAAIKRLSSQGIIMVAAAGNEGPNAAPSYPAAYPQVIAVTAVNSERESYSKANRGTYIDVAAPGVRIWTAKPGGSAGYESGTSFAAPFVSAMLASLVRPDDRSRERSDNPKGILQKLRYEDLGPPGPDRIYGRGLALAASACRTPVPSASIARAGAGWHVTTVRATSER